MPTLSLFLEVFLIKELIEDLKDKLSKEDIANNIIEYAKNDALNSGKGKK
jgi:hypothetical protein